MFIIDKKVRANADLKLNNPTIKKLWNSFCLKQSEIEFFEGEENTFVIGDAKIPILPEGKEFAISISSEGVAIRGCDYGGLVRGFMTFLMKINCQETVFTVNKCDETDTFKLKNRMIHICIFPEQDLYYIKKLVRFIGICQFTHIVIEPWGMLKYDTLKELSWENAFTKEEFKEIIKEVRELGMEPIPMLNQLGHATASRACYGKHVVLDQNPTLQYYFTPDGWAWNIRSEKTKELLRNVRRELYELFGEGSYMHIGCDEAYYYTRCDKDRKEILPRFLKELTDEVVKEGRRPMLWADMLLEKDKYKDCYATCEPDEVDTLRQALNEKSILVDWQYIAKTFPVPSLESLKDGVHDAMGAPWFVEWDNNKVHIDTVIEYNLFGIMLTTWHTLKDYISHILVTAQNCGVKSFYWSENSGHWEETATILRRVSFEGNSYTDSGFSKLQIEV